ncbi:hypothetical protein FBULB1_12655 [Fusarium bulbicola]|nr:hypothetical protein FBULB1_12655 [Fusarium bulbicola]
MSQGLFIGLLEMIFPGMTYLPYFAAFAFLTKYALESWSESITARFISTVEIHAQDETYNYLMNWVSRNNISQDSYRLQASAALNNSSFTWSEEQDDKPDVDDDEEDDPVGRQINEMRSKSSTSLNNAKPLYWTPDFGTHFFRYEGRMLAFTRSLEGTNYTSTPRQPEKLAISCLGRDATVLKRLLYNARIDFSEKQKGKTGIFRATKLYSEDEMSWTRCMSKATRPMSTIALDETLKEKLIKDLRRYLDRQTKHWYATRGIPYRRGYLFSGPPGTGKTSLTLAAAGLMGLDIYMVNLNSLRLAQRRGVDTATMGSQGRKKKKNAERLSLSGLLNIIDGAAAQEGRVLVMTSNHTENIDPALIRPGRIDFTINFQLATSEAAEGLFTQMFDAPDVERNSEKKAVKSLQDQAREFRDKIPNLALSPAAIQGFLLTHQEDPVGALAAVDEWVQDALKQKDVVVDESVESEKEATDSEEDEDSDGGSDISYRR